MSVFETSINEEQISKCHKSRVHIGCTSSFKCTSTPGQQQQKQLSTVKIYKKNKDIDTMHIYNL